MDSEIITMIHCQKCPCFIDSDKILCSDCRKQWIIDINNDARMIMKQDLPFPSLSRWI